MNHSRYLTDGHYSPYPVRKRNGDRNYEPAITLLPPDPYMLVSTPELPRPISPGVYRTAPMKTARDKKSSFVILGETLTTPVQSRPASPSGRVSPFRGHGFKSPTTSRANSRSVSPVGSPAKAPPKPILKKEKSRFNTDIGLPPKSPKKVVKSELKEYKPESPKRLAPRKPILKKPPVPPKKIGLKPILKPYAPPPKKAAGRNNVKKPVVPPKPKPTEEKQKPKPKSQEEKKPDPPAPEPTKPEEPKERLIPCFQPDKCITATPTMASPSQTTTPTISTSSSVTLNSLKNSEAAGTAVAAPTVLTSSGLGALSAAKALSGNLARRRQIEPAKTEDQQQPPIEKVTVTTTTTETIQHVQHVNSASSVKSTTDVSSSARSSTTTVRAASNGSLQSKSDVLGETISTTKLITSDPDMEVLSPNNLLNSPPRRPPMAWEEERIPNGDVPSNGSRKSRLRRFFDALIRLLGFLFCCRCSPCCGRLRCGERFQCCRRIKCPTSKCCKKTEPEPPDEPPPPKVNCCTKCRDRCCCKCNCCNKFLNLFKCKIFKCCKCCSSDKSCCKKLKCCEGSKCCKRKQKPAPKSDAKCCAKMSCDCKTCCKNCCDKVKNCCLDCRYGVNKCCRSLFCLNFMCCQRCLKKCKCCHKLKCCQKGGCCSCCNPYIKPEVRKRNNVKLDKKISRTSTHSRNKEKENLDQALVEHASLMKAAIPVLPTCLAVLCLILNLFLPGAGTLFSGIFCLCFGKARFSVKDTPQNRLGSFCVNIVIAVAQLFTVIFCLVGWGWSVWWGVIMYKLARKQKRLKLAEKNQQQEGGSSNVNQNHVDVEQG